MIFFKIMFPIMLLISTGFLTGKFIPDLDVKTLSKVSIYVFSPALVFTSLTRSSLTAADIRELGLVIFLLAGLLILFNMVCGRIFKLSRPGLSALNLSTVFMNVGNYGIPVALYAFGQQGMEREILILIYQAILVNTLGIFLASSSRLSWQESFLKVFKVPPIYAVLLALTVNNLQIGIPEGVMKALNTLADGSVPLFLLVLGLQLSKTSIKGNLKFILSASTIRLVISPLLTLILIYIFKIDVLNARVLLMASATPTGVVATLYSIEFDAEPQLVSGTTFVTTLLSFFTISTLLGFLI